MSDIKISIIIPIYNMEQYLEECISTVQEQSLKEIEVICIDDGSTDNSPNILDEKAKSDSRFIVLHQKNSGVADARNIGIRQAKGDYILFLDPDDYYPEIDTLKTLYDKVIENDALICGGSFSEVSPEGIVGYGDLYANGLYSGYNFSQEGFVEYKDYQFDFGFHRFIYKKEFLIDNKIFFPALTRYEDPPFMVEALSKAGKFYAIPKVTYRYRVGHKVTPWTIENVRDLLNGVLINATIARTNHYEKLYKYTVKRIYIGFRRAVLDGLHQDISLLPLVTQIFVQNLSYSESYHLSNLLNEFWIEERCKGKIYKSEFETIQKSVSYRLGLKLTYVPRKLYKQFFSRRDKKTYKNYEFSLDVDSLKQLRVATIMDDFSELCFKPECELMQIFPDNWKSSIQAFNPHLLFIESAWRGKDERWKEVLTNNPERLRDIVNYCNINHVPVVYWGKEDPASYDVFKDVARMADFVFTTDMDCIKKYKKELGHDRIWHMHFAAQPSIHNPIENGIRNNKYCFAGSYYKHYTERCEDFRKIVDGCNSGLGLDIYDRHYYDCIYEDNLFPDYYEPYIKGSVASSEIDRIYKGYLYGININTVKHSPTMFARRVFELMASNTIVVSNPSEGMQNYFGSFVITCDDADSFKEKLCYIEGHPEYMRKLRLAALREILSFHLYEDRLSFVVEKVFNKYLKPEAPLVSVIGIARTPDDISRLKKQFYIQSYKNKELLICADEISYQKTDLSCQGISIVGSGKKIKDICKGKYVAVFCADDWYGKNYLMDLILSTRYSDAEGFTKDTYMYEEGNEIKVLEGKEYQFVKVIDLTKGIINKHCIESLSVYQTVRPIETVEGKYLSVDRYNYCRFLKGESCPEAEDIDVEQ